MAPSISEKIIEVQDLHRSYGSLKAVEGVSLNINAGEVFGILGPNGAGKTTTVEILEGMRVPDKGLARINGVNVQTDPSGVKKPWHSAPVLSLL